MQSPTRFPEMLMVRLAPDDLARLREAAQRDERPPSTLARMLIRRGLRDLDLAVRGGRTK